MTIGCERYENPPGDFYDMMRDWLVDYGPDGHCDGYERIAEEAWNWVIKYLGQE